MPVASSAGHIDSGEKRTGPESGQMRAKTGAYGEHLRAGQRLSVVPGNEVGQEGDIHPQRGRGQEDQAAPAGWSGRGGAD